VLGDTEEEAHQNYQEIQDLILPEVGLSILAPYVGNIDLSQYDLDTKFADLDLSTGNGVQSRFEIILKEAIKNDLTLEEVYKKVAGSRGHHIFVGTPE
ncbi:nitrilotriacetate monooxygenase, partial [Staphylococcus pseudintermedius]